MMMKSMTIFSPGVKSSVSDVSEETLSSNMFESMDFPCGEPHAGLQNAWGEAFLTPNRMPNLRGACLCPIELRAPNPTPRPRAARARGREGKG